MKPESINNTEGSELRDEERTKCEVWTRVMGYHRPVAAFNAGKRSEHTERQYFVECHSAEDETQSHGHRAS